MSWFARKRAARFLIGALLWAVVWWLAVGAVLTYQPSFEPADRFSIVSLHADYRIRYSNDDGTWMKAVETIVVDYPAGSQIHGFERVLPTIEAGRRTPVTSLSVTMDEGWAPVDTKEGLTQVRAVIGSPTGAPLSGRHTYQLTYLVEGVIAFRDGRPQLAWDINGHAWAQGIGAVSAAITFESPLASLLASNPRCSVGTGRSAQPCSLDRTFNSDLSITLSSSPVRVDPHQSQTVVVAVGAGDIHGPPLATPTRVWLGLVWAVVGLTAVVALVNVVGAIRRDRSEARQVGISMRFTPRSNLPPSLAASLVGSPARGLLAEVVRAGVEGQITFSGGAEDNHPLTATLVSWPAQWSAESQDTLLAVLRSRLPGTKVSLERNIATGSPKELIALQDLAADQGLMSRVQHSANTRAAKAGLVAAAAVLIPALIVSGRVFQLPTWWVVIPAVVLVVSLATHYGLLLRWRQFTAKGRDAMTYLKGVRMFLTSGEASQVRAVHNSGADTPSDAERVEILTSLAPYAVALGVEDAWRRAVGQDPDAPLAALTVAARARVSVTVDGDSGGAGGW